MKLILRIVGIILRIAGSLVGLFFVLYSYFFLFKVPLSETPFTDPGLQNFFAGLGMGVGLVIFFLASGIYGYIFDR